LTAILVHFLLHVILGYKFKRIFILLDKSQGFIAIAIICHQMEFEKAYEKVKELGMSIAS